MPTFTVSFLGEGSPTKIDVLQKNRVPTSNLSTGGPRGVQASVRGGHARAGACEVSCGRCGACCFLRDFGLVCLEVEAYSKTGHTCSQSVPHGLFVGKSSKLVPEEPLSFENLKSDPQFLLAHFREGVLI